MQLSVEDKSYLWDIDDACKDITKFLDNKTLEDFDKEKIIRFAVERQLLVIGEASKKLSDDARSKIQDVPWKKIIGLRNIIAHEYGEILVERIWRIAIEDISILKKKIESIIEKE
jgi:uncharacterized protein with HEPN domain